MEWIVVVIAGFGFFLIAWAVSHRDRAGSGGQGNVPPPAAAPAPSVDAWSQVEAELQAELKEDDRRRLLVAEAGQVDGLHYTKWIPRLDALRRDKRDGEALTLLLKCIDATEREAVVQNELFPPVERDGISGAWYPAPGYYERAAIIYRRQKDYASEIEILDRWEERASTPHALRNLTGHRLAVRKKRAIELMNSR